MVHQNPSWGSFRSDAGRLFSLPSVPGLGVAARRGNPLVLRTRFAMAAAALDLVTTVAAAVSVGVVYHLAFYDQAGPVGAYLVASLVLGILFVAVNILGDEYDITRFHTPTRHARRVALLWNATFVAVLLLVFLTKTMGDFSRATIILVYGFGYLCLVGVRLGIARQVRRDASLAQATAQRVFLVGREDEIARFTARHEAAREGLRIVAAVALRGPETTADDLALAAASARMLRPDDVFVLMPWAEEETIDACVKAFMRVPAAIHLGPDRVLDRFEEARIGRVGSIASLNLVRPPLTRTEVALKRGFDIAVATLAMVLLLPLFLLVALAIKLDSPGPALFVQRRYGFNQEPFRIVKFRSMTTMEDGRAVRQAVKGDARVTRVGRFIRRYNIDELPQILNVLRGEMSIVGPRPHALAHDQLFDRTIADYSRRHNVKPGITGWAQVNGFRGPFLGDGSMHDRVAHDLHYIDNWSMALDLRIMVLTVVSAKAFRNAF